MSGARITHLNTSGQALLMSIMLGLIVVIACAAVFFTTQLSSRHRIASSQKTKGRAVMEDGLGYAAARLSASLTSWQNALNADFTGTDCNTGSAVISPAGEQFKIYCSTGRAGNPNLQPYQVAVRVLALNPGTLTPGQAVRAYLSQRTLGIDLGIGVRAATALQLFRQPGAPPQGSLDVHWGPIACLDSSGANAWTVPDPADSQRYPRKLSPGGLTGAFTRSGTTWGAGPMTDQMEYWAHASVANSPRIDEAYYVAAATNSVVPIAPVNGAGTAIPREGCAAGVNCGVFKPLPGDTAIFDGTGSGYSPPAGVTIFVIGSAQFQTVAMNVAAMVVTENLTVSNSAGGASSYLHVPVTAPLEYPYYPTPPADWPCRGKQGNMDSSGQPLSDCASSEVFTAGQMNFRGFLHVKGNMTLDAAATHWNMSGALLVGDADASPGAGGQLVIPSGAGLTLAYDDFINHAIRVNPVAGTVIQLSPDLVEEIPVF